MYQMKSAASTVELCDAQRVTGEELPISPHLGLGGLAEPSPQLRRVDNDRQPQSVTFEEQTSVVFANTLCRHSMDHFFSTTVVQHPNVHQERWKS